MIKQNSEEQKYDYNHLIQESDIEILSEKSEWTPQGVSRESLFKYQGNYFKHTYESHRTAGRSWIFIFQYNSEWFDGNSAITIYSTNDQKDCTSLGRFLQHSIVKNHLLNNKFK